jgi:hypothetical protein
MSAHSSFFARDWRPVERNCLRGFFSLLLPKKLILCSCSLYVRNDERWISSSIQPYKPRAGRTEYAD